MVVSAFISEVAMVESQDIEGVIIDVYATEGALGEAHISCGGVMDMECKTDCVFGTLFKRSEVIILANNSSRFSGKRLGTGNGKRAVLLRAARRESRCEDRRALMSKEEH